MIEFFNLKITFIPQNPSKRKMLLIKTPNGSLFVLIRCRVLTILAVDRGYLAEVIISPSYDRLQRLRVLANVNSYMLVERTSLPFCLL